MKWLKYKAVIAIPLALVVTAGAVRIGMAYRAGNGFHPFETDREMQNNQVLFPDGENGAGGQKENQDTDSFWEKDRTEKENDEAGADNGYLFDREKETPADEQTGALVQDGAAPSDVPGSDAKADQVFEITDDGSSADVILPDDGSQGGGNGQGENGETGGNGEAGGGTISGGGSGGMIPGGGDNDNAGGGGGGAVPEPTPDPVTPGTDAVAGDPGEYDKTNPTEDSIFSDVKKYDEGSLPDASDTDALGRLVVQIFGTNSLYAGQTVDRRVIFNSLMTYVLDTSTFTVHYWGADALDQYVSIDAVAFGADEETAEWHELTDSETLTIPKGMEQMLIRVRYRLRESDEWTDYPTLTYYLAENRILLLNTRLADGEKIEKDWMLNADSINQTTPVGSRMNLYYWAYNLYRNRSAAAVSEQAGAGQNILTELFPGWMENNILVDWFYPVTAGRHVLEASDFVPLDTGAYQVELKDYWLDEDYNVYSGTQLGGSLSYLQTLTYYKGYESIEGAYDIKYLKVPEYVQAVDFPYSEEDTEYLELPASVVYVNTVGVPTFLDSVAYNYGLGVMKGYIVADGNPRYTAEDGILYSVDKTQILGVPTEVRTLTAAAEVTKVVLPYQSRLEKLVLEAESIEDIPTVNYDRVPQSCRIVVPDALLDDYLRAESDTLQNRRLTASAAENEDVTYTIQGPLAVSGSGLVHLALDEMTRWLSLPDTVSGMETDAVRGQEELTMVFLPKSGGNVTLEAGCFDGAPQLQAVVCYSQQQYNAAAAVVPEGVEVRLMGKNQGSGYSYLEVQGQVMLLSVPEDITEFDGTIPLADGGTLTVNAISDNAFAGCEQLRWVALPEQTTAIGYQAFKDCYALEGVTIDADEIMIGQSAFENCNSLRFVASNAETCELKDTSLTLPSGSKDYSFLFAPGVNSGYNGNWTGYTDLARYDMVDCGGTRVLYGVDEYGQCAYVLRAGALADGTVELLPETQVILRYAFEDTRASGEEGMTVNWSNLNNLTMIQTKAFAGSDIGSVVEFAPDLMITEEAFAGCHRLTEITLPSFQSGVGLTKMAFKNCTALEKVTIGEVNYTHGMDDNVFAGCDALESIEFTGSSVPNVIIESPGMKFHFNGELTPGQEAERIRLIVPEETEEDYIRQWRYAFEGYSGGYDAWSGEYMTAYQAIWNEVYNGTDWSELDEVFAGADSVVLAGENRIRRMLGIDPADTVEHTYTYTIDGNGIITLTGARNVLSTDLSSMMGDDLPFGWSVDYIGRGAFANSPELRTLTIPTSLVGICDGAFEGITFSGTDEDDDFYRPESLMLSINDTTDLVIEEEGRAFDFGIPDDKIELMLGWESENYDWDQLIRDWLLPMAGYTSLKSMQTAYSDENGELYQADYEAALIAAENRIRTLVGGEDADYPLIDSVEDMIGLTEPPEPEEPEGPEWPDWPEWPDDFSMPSENPAEDPDADGEENGGTDNPEETPEEPDEDTPAADGNEAVPDETEEEETEE